MMPKFLNSIVWLSMLISSVASPTPILYPTSIGLRTLNEALYEIEVEVPGEPDYALLSMSEIYPTFQKMTSKFLNFPSGSNHCPLILLEINGVDYNAFPAIGSIEISQPETPNENYRNQIRLHPDGNHCNCQVNRMQRANLIELSDDGVQRSGYDQTANNVDCVFLVTYDELPEGSTAHEIMGTGIYNLRAVDFNHVENLTALLESERIMVWDQELFEDYLDFNFTSYDDDYVMTTYDRAPAGMKMVFMMGDDNEILHTMPMRIETVSSQSSSRGRYKFVAWSFIGISIGIFVLLAVAIGVVLYNK